jgi:subtilase family serine protease
VKESNETNNNIAGNQINILPSDLVLTSVSGPASVATGQNITAAATVMNQGAGRAGTFYISLYLSTDAVITTSDKYIGRIYIGSGLAAGAQQTVNITGTISATQAPGSYFLGAIADYLNSVKESNETNNNIAGNQIVIKKP